MHKALIVLIYIIIIILIPLFLDYLFTITVRKRRCIQLEEAALEVAKKKAKSLVVFNSLNGGYVMNLNSKGTKVIDTEVFDGDFVQSIEQMAPDSCVVLVAGVLEYLPTTTIKNVINQLKSISGGDLFVMAFEKNSPRIFWDYQLLNVFNNSCYYPGEKISWNRVNGLAQQIQKFYKVLFYVIPYSFFAKQLCLACVQKKLEK